MSEDTDVLTFRLRNGMKCEVCQEFSKLVQVCNSATWDGEGFFLGIEAVVTYDSCGHIVPDSSANPTMVAALLNRYQTGDGKRVEMNGILEREEDQE